MALLVTPANEQERAQVEELATAVQAVTGEHVELAYVDQGYTGEEPAAAAADHSIQLAVVKLPEAKRGFVLLPRRWVVERGFAWATRFRRLAPDYERLATTLAALHFLAFVCLLLHRFTALTLCPSQPLGHNESARTPRGRRVTMPASMLTAQQVLKAALEAAHGTLETTMADVDDDLANRPAPGVTNPIGSSYAHVALAEDAIVNGLLQG